MSTDNKRDQVPCAAGNLHDQSRATINATMKPALTSILDVMQEKLLKQTYASLMTYIMTSTLTYSTSSIIHAVKTSRKNVINCEEYEVESPYSHQYHVQ